MQKILVAISASCLLLLSGISMFGQPKSLDQAVASLRNIGQQGLSDAEMEAKTKEIDESWKYLIAAGQKGSDALKQEIQKVDTAKEKDDVFKLNATVVIWNIGKANDAEYIAKLWSSTPLSAQYNYVFYTAMEAAQTADPKVLPMLISLLKDDKGGLFFHMHAMNVRWPLTHEFIWGAFGSKGLPALQKILNTSTDPIELRSAMQLLTRAQFLPALSRLRELAKSDQNEVRWQAIQSLGSFGHPDDYGMLIAGLRSNDPKEVFNYVFALYEYDDLRSVEHLLPLAQTSDMQLKVELYMTFRHLLTPASYAAAKKIAASVTEKELKEYLDTRIEVIRQKLPPDYDKKTLPEQSKLLSAIRNEEFILDKNEAILSRERLTAALQEWKSKRRIYGSNVKWIGTDQLIAAARPEDLDALIDTKASFYSRLSDECLYEVRDFDKAIKYIGRSRYRKGVGITEMAELK